jgi:DNA-binding MarR family transcriptional regulator
MTSQSPPPAEAARPAEAAPPAEPAARVWVALQAFVTAQDRHRELRAAFDFGRGRGRLTALLTLANGPLTMGELAEWQGIDPPNATVIVDKLESRGLVERTPHPEGNRRKLVTLTEAGRKAAAQASEILARPPAAIAELPPDDLAALERILTRLAEAAAGVG